MTIRFNLTPHWMGTRRRQLGLAAVALLAAGLALSACKLKNAEPGPFGGPSELGLSLTITATPNALTKDGRSTAQIVITARGPNGEPLGSIVATLEICTERDTNNDGSADCFDYGRLSLRRIVTDGAGRATITYTAPNDPSVPGRQESIRILVTPEGTEFGSTIPREVTIRLLPQGGAPPPGPVILPPVAAFTVSASPTAGVPVAFDATGSENFEGEDDGVELPLGVAVLPIIDFTWDFGDGTRGKGEVTTHTYDEPDSYLVSLTVSNGVLSDTVTAVVTVAASANPTASFTVTPTAPDVDERTFFNASGSTAATGREIVKFSWSFSDNNTAIGVTTVRRFGEAGDIDVTLTVRDDLGNEDLTSIIVIVGAGSLTASFVTSPSAPGVDDTVNFDASASTAPGGATIVRYEWNFGDGRFMTTSGPDVTHAYSVAGVFTVTLVVTDSEGRTATDTEDVTVS